MSNFGLDEYKVPWIGNNCTSGKAERDELYSISHKNSPNTHNIVPKSLKLDFQVMFWIQNEHKFIVQTKKGAEVGTTPLTHVAFPCFYWIESGIGSLGALKRQARNINIYINIATCAYMKRHL